MTGNENQLPIPQITDFEINYQFRCEINLNKRWAFERAMIKVVHQEAYGKTHREKTHYHKEFQSKQIYNRNEAITTANGAAA